MADQPLTNIRVIDLTTYIAGPYCTKLLADFGADVIKIENPKGGDPSRTLGPFPGDVPDPEKSGLFLHLNTNKRSVALDLQTPEGKSLLQRLIAGADVLVESFRPGVLESFGVDVEELERRQPNLVITRISTFGQTGPYRDYLAGEITLFGMGGKMNSSGNADRYPIMLGGDHVQYQAGNNAAMASPVRREVPRHRRTGGRCRHLRDPVGLVQLPRAGAGAVLLQPGARRPPRQRLRRGLPAGLLPVRRRLHQHHGRGRVLHPRG
jgi:formyl-CoA transferase/CoA:oxalate CoA-transferase